MKVEHPSEIDCAYCGNKFNPPDKVERFCSKRCNTLFNKRYSLEPSPMFDLSSELSKLQMIIQNTKFPDNDWNGTSGLAFYDSVFRQLAVIVKWINSQAIEKEKHKEHEPFEELEKKLHVVLKKASELKKENSDLKKKLRFFMAGDKKLARTILGVEEKASQDQIKNAYKEKVKLTHPDLAEGNEDLFKAVKMALELLSSH